MNEIRYYKEGERPRLQKDYAVKASVKEGRYVRALVSIWDNVDRQGDRVRKGAFSKSLQKWAASGRQIPYLWAHSWQDPFHHLGRVLSARETDLGLEVEAELDVDTNPAAAEVYRLLKDDRVTQHSFAYDDVVQEQKLKDGSTELLELEIFECGPCLQGANPLTDVLSVKSATPTTAPKASEDVARMRQHLRTGHSVSKVATSGKTMQELRVLHAVAHAEVPASAEHLATGTTDGDVEIPTTGKSELAAYKARIAKLEGKARRPKSDAGVRAEVNRLYDEHVLAERLEELKADETILGVREHRREQEARQRAIQTTEARR